MPEQPPVPENRNVFVGRTLFGGGVEVPSNQVDKDFWKAALLYQFLYSLAGLVSGLLCILGGILLFVNGIMGSGKWTADFFGVTISDAAPGVVLFIVGVVVTELTKFTIRIVPTRDNRPPQTRRT